MIFNAIDSLNIAQKKKTPNNESGVFNNTGNVLLSRTGLPCSTIGAIELNFRVRNGIGCDLYAIVTGKDL